MVSRLIEVESCFLLELTEDDAAAISHTAFNLACGEVLLSGDCFTEIGSSGSAGNQPITLTPPWVQRYIGTLNTGDVEFNWLPTSWQGRELVLFDAFNPDDDTEGFASPAHRAKWKGTKSVKDGLYMAYLRHCDDKLFHTRGSSASNVCQCTSLKRWAPKVQNEHSQT